MKLHITTIIAIGASLGLSSCAKFLEEDPKSTSRSCKDSTINFSIKMNWMLAKR
mgnify:CR=1 FL=1